MKRVTATVLALAALAAASCARRPAITPPTSDFEVRATLSTNRVAVGEPVDLTIEVFHPADTAVQLPGVDHPPEIVLREHNVQTSEYKPGVSRTLARHRLVSLRPGKHAVATGEVARVSTKGAGVTNQPMPLLEIDVRSVIPDLASVLTKDGEQLAPSGTTNSVAPARIMPARDTFHAPPESIRERLVILTLVILGIALVLALLGWLVVRMGTRVKAARPPPPLPLPHLVALRELEELKARGWIERGESEPFFVAISAILRRYVEDRFHVRAPEMTTEEFIAAASESRGLAPEHQQLMRDFLTRCDLVKFARHTPAPESLRDAYDTGERFVRDSAPTPPAPGGAA